MPRQTGYSKRPSERCHSRPEVREVRIFDDAGEGRRVGPVAVGDDAQAVVKIAASDTDYGRPAAWEDRRDVEVQPVPAHIPLVLSLGGQGAAVAKILLGITPRCRRDDSDAGRSDGG